MPVEQAICNDADIGTPLDIIRVDLSVRQFTSRAVSVPTALSN